jgi:hypothetical protein
MLFILCEACLNGSRNSDIYNIKVAVLNFKKYLLKTNFVKST